MIETLKYKKLTWIDLENPTVDEVKKLAEKYSIHPVVAEELLQPTLRPKVDFHKDYLYLILHFPIFDSNKMEYVTAEIDFIVGKNFLISAHHRTIAPLHEMAKILEADAILKESSLVKDTGALLFFVLRQLYNFTQKQLDHIQLNIDEIGKGIFERRNQYDDLVRKMSHVRKDVLDFRKITQLHKEIYTSLDKSADILGKEFPHYLNNINGEFLRVWHITENQKETIASLQSTADSLLNHRSNEIMKNLTIMAFVTFPLMLLSSLFAMGTEHTPIVGTNGDFWIILGIMFMATITMYFHFKRKKWL